MKFFKRGSAGSAHPARGMLAVALLLAAGARGYLLAPPSSPPSWRAAHVAGYVAAPLAPGIDAGHQSSSSTCLHQTGSSPAIQGRAPVSDAAHWEPSVEHAPGRTTRTARRACSIYLGLLEPAGLESPDQCLPPGGGARQIAMQCLVPLCAFRVQSFRLAIPRPAQRCCCHGSARNQHAHPPPFRPRQPVVSSLCRSRS